MLVHWRRQNLSCEKEITKEMHHNWESVKRTMRNWRNRQIYQLMPKFWTTSQFTHTCTCIAYLIVVLVICLPFPSLLGFVIQEAVVASWISTTTQEQCTGKGLEWHTGLAVLKHYHMFGDGSYDILNFKGIIFTCYEKSEISIFNASFIIFVLFSIFFKDY